MRALRNACLTAIIAVGALAACDQGPAPVSEGVDPATAAAEVEALKAQVAAFQADADAATKPHADQGPGVYFANLKDGQTVTSPVRVVFGLYGMGIAPALIEKENTGHHHLLVDTELTEEEKQFAIPNDGQHIHFGAGQTETVLELTPGQHTLQLALGDLHHELMKPPVMSPKITITVK